MRNPLLFVGLLAVLTASLAFASPDADALMAQKIEERFAQSDAAAYIHANVEVMDGVATLTGSARTTYARRIAEREALAVPGVQHIVNRLRVEPNP